MFVVFFAVLLVLITNIVFLHYIRKRKFRSLNNIPGPKSYPVIGNLLEFRANLVDTFKTLLRLSTQYNNTPFFKLWLGPWNLYLFSTDPQFIEYILSSPKCMKKSADYNLFKDFTKNGLVNSNGSYWQKHRKLLNSAFNLKLFENYVRIFNAKTNILIEKLANQVDKGDFDVHPYISNCTFDVISESAMGISVDAQTTDNKMLKSVKKGMSISISRLFSIWKRFDKLFQLFSPDCKTLQKLVEYGEKYTKHFIDERRKYLLNNNRNEAETTDDVGIKNKKKVILDILLEGTIDGKPLTDEEILEEVNTFTIANKAFSEVKDVFQDDRSYKPRLEDLNSMKYMELVLKETLRLYPSAPYILRQLEDDVNYNGTIIPKDTTIVPFIYAMQRRKDLFPNASKFDPDRFLSQSDTMLPFSYIPFSAGPRNCIGQKFGMWEATCILSKLIMNFEILPSDSKCDLQIAAAIVLQVPNGVHIQLKRRQ